MDLTFLPVSALHGDNIVERSANMPYLEPELVLRPGRGDATAMAHLILGLLA